MSNEIEEKELSFEHKIDSAKVLLEKLSKQDITLSDSMDLYKEGISTIQEAQKLLDEAKLQFEELNS